MFVVPNFPHLRGVEMQVKYSELLLPLLQPGPIPSAKWKSDSDVDPTEKYAPRPNFYMNGEVTRTGQIANTRLLNAPPPGDNRVPRFGLLQIYPGDPDYEKMCREQGLSNCLQSNQTSPTSSINPQIGETDHRPPQVNGITPPGSDISKSINGGSPHGGSVLELQSVPRLTNGVGEHVSSPTETSNPPAI